MKYLILGAGPAGLTAANKLREIGEDSFLVLEKEETAGGLCRSAMVDGSPLDVGGGHFLDVRRPEVNSFLFKFMPEDEWDKYDRDSRIEINGNVVGHPIEANIWQMPLDEQVEYLKSIAQAGCNQGASMPEEFVKWIYWKLGTKIANEYMIPYNQKMFADDLNLLGTYWLEKLPNVSFEDTLRSCLEKRAYGKQPGHAQFYYPKKYGYGELWIRMADALGSHILYEQNIKTINFHDKTVETVNGTRYQADKIITTIPWKTFEKIEGMPKDMQEDIAKLRHSSVEIRYYPENLDTDAQWIYYPEPKLAYHRILVRHNFCPNSRGYWTETRKERQSMIPKEEMGNISFMNDYAYPLNTLDKPSIMTKLLHWSSEQGVYGLGRWGEHEHYNSDVTVARGMELVSKI